MSDIKISSKTIRQIARQVDDAGNNNNYIDGDEISVFTEKLEAKGVSNAKQIVKDYMNNSFNYELQFSKDGTKRTDGLEYEIYAALNQNSFLNSNQKTTGDADSIYSAIKSAFAVWGWTWLDDLDRAVNRINKDNVLAVLNKYSEEDSLVKRLNSEVSQDYLTKYGNRIVDALIKAADDRGVDVTDIVTKDDAGKFVAVSVEGVDFNASATDSDNLAKVVNVLKERINTTVDTLTDSEKFKKNPQESMLLLARYFDKNTNGYIDGEEVSAFKAACAKLGVFVNDILASINKKTKDGDTLNEQEKTVQNIFSSETNMIADAEEKRAMNNRVMGITQAVDDENETTLGTYIKEITSENVEEILTELDKNEKFKDGFGKALYDEFGNDSRGFTSVIIKALYDKAEKENVDVSDIVRLSGESFVTPTGDDALDSKNVNSVINDLRSKIKQELGE